MLYDREMAISYAIEWALSRNPKYYNYDFLGGDCTNYVSQCIYAGFPQMNYERNGWYYIDANVKSPSWTGVEFLFEFLVSNRDLGPSGRLIKREEIEEGDIIQLNFSQNVFGHSLFVTKVSSEDIFVCAHTIDSLNRPLNSYIFEDIRYIKVY